jgi:single-strand DNA-binding protein
MINRVVLVGRLTKDPELRYTANNIAVVSFTIAVNRNYTGQDGQSEADYLPCVAWRKQAENIAKYVGKGSMIAVDGRIQTRNYEAQDGTRRYITEIVCDNTRFLDTRAPSEGGSFDMKQPFPPMDEPKDDPFASLEDIEIGDDDLPF